MNSTFVIAAKVVEELNKTKESSNVKKARTKQARLGELNKEK
jgi:hypothetical protein